VGVSHEPTKDGFTWTLIGQGVAMIGSEVQRVLTELTRHA
jgi:hypothetical protein